MSTYAAARRGGQVDNALLCGHRRHVVLEGVRYGFTPVGPPGSYNRADLDACPSLPRRTRPDGCQTHGCCEHGMDYCVTDDICDACEADLDDQFERMPCAYSTAGLVLTGAQADAVRAAIQQRLRSNDA